MQLPFHSHSSHEVSEAVGWFVSHVLTLVGAWTKYACVSFSNAAATSSRISDSTLHGHTVETQLSVTLDVICMPQNKLKVLYFEPISTTR